MKKKYLVWVAMIFAVAWLLAGPLKTFAAETVLTTTVPTEFSLRIEVDGQGTVFVNGTEYRDGDTVVIPRNTDALYRFTPDNGHKLTSVVYNGIQHIGECKDGTLQLFVDNNAVLQIRFTAISQGPQTGDTDNIVGVYAVMALALLTVAGTVAHNNTNKKEQL